VSGVAALARGDSASSIDMGDYALKVTKPGGPQANAPLHFGPYGARESEATFGALKVHAVKMDEARAGATAIAITATEGDASASATLYYGEPPAKVAIGRDEYDVAFGSTQEPLPFTLTLLDARTEYYDAASLPKSYAADVVISDAAQRSAVQPAGKANAATPAPAESRGAATRVRVNSPARAGGYTIYLIALEGDAAVFEIVRDPGAQTLFAGGALFLAGLIWTYAGRLKTTHTGMESQ
jgi:hypothetical protein